MNTVEPYVRVTRLIRAPREKVYNAWLDPEVRKLWWGASPEMTCGECNIDPQVGSQFRIAMVQGEHEHVAFGEFVELKPFDRIVSTWSWEGTEMGKDTRLTLDLFDAEFEGRPATELQLLHEKLNDPLERSDHTTGWLGCLKNLGKMFADLDVPSSRA